MSPINLGITAGSNAVLQTADMYAQAKNYNGSGDLLDESGGGHDFQFGSTSGSDTNDPLFLEYTGTTYLYLSGVNGNYATTTDKAQLDITGDIDLIAHVALDDWTPASLAQAIITKWGSTTDRSFYWAVNTNGTLFISWFEGGGTQRSVTSTAATGFTDGTAHWIRVTIDVDNGGGDTDVKFYTSNDGSSWTQLGSTINVGSTTSIRAGAGAVRLGSIPLFTFDLKGKYYRAIIKDGIDGTIVGDFNADGQTNHSSWVDGYGNTWSIARSSTNKKSCLVDENKFLLGTDDYFELADDNTFDFGPNQDFTLVLVFRNFSSGGTDIYGITKIDSSLNDGWALYTFFGFSILSTKDGGGGINTSSPSVSSGVRTVHTGRRRAGTDITAFVNTTAGTAVADTSVDTSTAFPIRIGADADGVNFANAEIMSVAIFKRALTDNEIEKLNDELAQS